jgi:hypothetical protein
MMLVERIQNESVATPLHIEHDQQVPRMMSHVPNMHPPLYMARNVMALMTHGSPGEEWKGQTCLRL